MSVMYVLVKNITKLIKDRKHATRHKFVLNSTQIFSITLFALSLHIPINVYQFVELRMQGHHGTPNIATECCKEGNCRKY